MARRILVANGTPELADMTRRAAPPGVEVDEASGSEEILRKIQHDRPDLILLMKIEPAKNHLDLVDEIRRGWISRHSSLQIIEAGPEDISFRILPVDTDNDSNDTRSESPVSGEVFISRLRDTILLRFKERENKLKTAVLDPDVFCLIWEQIPGPGAYEIRQENVLRNARKAAGGDKICAISVTDNPGGNPSISTDVLSREIRDIGVEPLVHVAFRDRSRNESESLLYQLAAIDIRNLLLLTGDYPAVSSYQGSSQPVFDLDAVNGLRLVAEMNSGMEHEIMRRKVRLADTDFFTGVAFSPFKREEAEVMGQYYKLQKKIAAGAHFLITQVGYDARKLHEILIWLKRQDKLVKAIASIYVLPYPTAKVMNANRIPGCVVTDKMLAEIALEASGEDKGRNAQLERAARMYAVVRGMGFDGASISGQNLPYESVEYIVDKGNELLEHWHDFVPEFDFPQDGGFYLFEKDSGTGLNHPKPAPRSQAGSRSLTYSFSLAVHKTAMVPGRPLFTFLAPMMRFVDRHKFLAKIFGFFEHLFKVTLYDCQNCGDCALYEVAYLCPMSQCPKNQRNGPCGGSYNGWCEVYPDERKCVWVKAYRRFKSGHHEDDIGKTIVPPNNWELWQTPSWLNFFTGRDHSSRNISLDSPSLRNTSGSVNESQSSG